MLSLALASLLALAPPAADAARGAGPSAAPSQPAPRHRTVRRPAPLTPDLSPRADPYRRETSERPPRVDPKRPDLTVRPYEVDDDASGPARVAPVPPDPWAPAVAPLQPGGATVRPPGPGG